MAVAVVVMVVLAVMVAAVIVVLVVLAVVLAVVQAVEHHHRHQPARTHDSTTAHPAHHVDSRRASHCTFGSDCIRYRSPSWSIRGFLPSHHTAHGTSRDPCPAP